MNTHLTKKQLDTISRITKTADSGTIALGWLRRGKGRSAQVIYEEEGAVRCVFLFNAAGEIFRARYYEAARLLGDDKALNHTLDVNKQPYLY